MGKLTTKYQLTVPKSVSKTAGLKPGDELECEPAGNTIQVRPKTQNPVTARSTTDQLILFDLATERQRHRERSQVNSPVAERGWTRDELYET